MDTKVCSVGVKPVRVYVDATTLLVPLNLGLSTDCKNNSTPVKLTVYVLSGLTSISGAWNACRMDLLSCEQMTSMKESMIRYG
ncbi:MAG: hypothetical protein CMJ82_07540 [Planctomycetaceae bacterium]|nr:hypothetical protein [Planctomycetaceae bacterium]